jgi:hypothetical protein
MKDIQRACVGNNFFIIFKVFRFDFRYGLSPSDGVPHEGISCISAAVFTAESEKQIVKGMKKSHNLTKNEGFFCGIGTNVLDSGFFLNLSHYSSAFPEKFKKYI